jgi:3-isopropylmalate dehydrogenase
MSRRYRVACLAGDGVGPELMAEASRALAEVSSLHGFHVEEAHLPFGGDAVRRFGHALPPSTRAACREADAILVAATREPALDGVIADLDVTWRINRVLMAGKRNVAIVSPLRDEAPEHALQRAFRLACSHRARVTAIGSDHAWLAALEQAQARCEGVIVEHLSFEAALPLLARSTGRFDVIATEHMFAEALVSMAAFAHEGPRMVASGRLGARGPGVFGPTHGSAPDIAGQGVANPSAMLLAAALMVGEGLGERAAAETLEGGVAETLATGVRTPDLLAAGAAATTRQFMDVLIAALPGARRDVEFVEAS